MEFETLELLDNSFFFSQNDFDFLPFYQIFEDLRLITVRSDDH